MQDFSESILSYMGGAITFLVNRLSGVDLMFIGYTLMVAGLFVFFFLLVETFKAYRRAELRFSYRGNVYRVLFSYHSDSISPGVGFYLCQNIKDNTYKNFKAEHVSIYLKRDVPGAEKKLQHIKTLPYASPMQPFYDYHTTKD